MHSDYNSFLANKRPSIVEVFNGYLPPRASSPKPSVLPARAAVETIAQVANRSLELIPSRFDFSDNLLGAVRPDPRTLARFLSKEFQHKDLIIIDCAPTESILTTAAYHASANILVPVKPEFFATIGFPLLRQSIDNFKNQNRGNSISVCGVVINNAFYDGGNNGGPEKGAAIRDIRREAKKNSWSIYENEIPHSRGFPKIMRGNYNYQGNAQYFSLFSNEFFRSLGL